MEEWRKGLRSLLISYGEDLVGEVVEIGRVFPTCIKFRERGLS